MKTVTILLILPLWFWEASSVEEKHLEKLPLEKYLTSVGKRLDVFFTVEAAYSGNYSDVLLSKSISFSHAPQNIESAVFTLTNAFTNLTVIVATNNARIYHIVDRRLTALNGYAMNQTLNVIEYEGNAADFVTLAGRKAPGLCNQNLFFGPVYKLNDATHISITATNVCVRDALSEGVSLRSSNRIIWTSVTSIEGLKTPVRYR